MLYDSNDNNFRRIDLFLPFLANALEAGDDVVSKEFITEPPNSDFTWI